MTPEQVANWEQRMAAWKRLVAAFQGKLPPEFIEQETDLALDARLTWYALHASQQIDGLAKHVRWQAQTVHQAYHHGAECPGGDRITWRECQKNTCASARATLQELGLEV